MTVDVGWKSINDGWSLERHSWRKEKLELVSAVASAVDQSCVIIYRISLCLPLLARSPDNPQRIRVASVFEFSDCSLSGGQDFRGPLWGYNK